MITPFNVPFWFDIGATFLFALAGTLQGVKKGYDIIGTFTIAFVSSVGGGLIRDGIFLQQGAPALTQHGEFLMAILVAMITTIFFRHWMSRITIIIEVVDALGLGAYAVVGMQKSILAGLSLPAVVLVGVINAVGGGILRDVLTREEPILFKPGQFYAAAAVVGCLTFLMLFALFKLDTTVAALITIGVTFTLRLLAIQFNWRTVRIGN